MVVDNYAYSLSQDELGWKWRVYAEDGDIVGSGREKTQNDAEGAVKRAITTVLGHVVFCRSREVDTGASESLAPGWAPAANL